MKKLLKWAALAGVARYAYLKYQGRTNSKSTEA